MNSRERVLKAIRAREGSPDRVPVQFDLCKQHVQYFSEKYSIETDISESIFEDVTWRISANELRVKMGSDLIITGATNPAGWKKRINADGTWFNEYQMRMRQGAIYVDIIDAPLKDAETAEDVEKYKFPDPLAPGRYVKAEELVAKYKKDFCIVGDIEGTIFALARNLVGMEKLLCDLQSGEEYVGLLFEKCAQYSTAIGLELIKQGVDIIWTGDDYGTQTGLLMSPHIFREKIKPLYKKMIEAFKLANPDIIMAFHCDGAISALLDDFIDVGFNIFNPVQPNVPGHSPEELKELVGDRLSFWGAIDQQSLLPSADYEKIDRELKSIIQTLGHNKGFIVGPAHIIQADVTPECVEEFIRLCISEGKFIEKEQKGDHIKPKK